MESKFKHPFLDIDAYKFVHLHQYPAGTEWLYLTWTPRKSKIEDLTHVVHYGLQGALMEIAEEWHNGFFSRPFAEIEKEYIETGKCLYATTNPDFANNIDTTHLRKVHELGYLPLRFKAVPEGTFVPIGAATFTVENTVPHAYWLPGYFESNLSSRMWMPTLAATLANKKRRILKKYADLSGDPERVFFQCCDFSMRGTSSPESAIRASGGHLTSFAAASTVGVRKYLMTCYDAPPDVTIHTPSTEHSVITSYGQDELATYTHLMTAVHPTGNFSIVADSYDFWGVIDNILPQLKDKIIARNGKTIIRPDSGDPTLILVGDPNSPVESVRKGLVQRMAEIFGTTTNDKGFKVLHPKVGVIYGDLITAPVITAVCEGLMKKGFATTNVNFGVGSKAYQANLRDTFGFAMKATCAKIDGEIRQIFKDPITDVERTKKSQRGMVALVEHPDGRREFIQELTPETEAEVKNNLYQDVFVDGKFTNTQTFADIRERIKKESIKIYGV